MLSGLISSSVKGRVVVLALCGLLIAYGLRTVRTAPLDVFPEFAPPKVEVQTEAPGLSTDEVEGLISVPLENALNGTPGLKTIRSKSVLGLSSVVMLFEEGADVHKVRQYVQERVAAEAVRLPVVARPPVILQPLSSLSRLLKIGVSSKTMSQQDMTVLALWTIRPKLMSVPGVANVAIWGQRDKQYQVLVNPDRLRAEGVTLDQVVRAAGDATVLDSGGFLDKPNQRLAVRHRSMVRDPDDLARTVVAFQANSPVRLGEVARVQFGSPPAIGDAIINDGPGLLLIVEKQPEGNTLEVTRRVEAALKDLQPGLAGLDVDPTIFRPATFIERSVGNLAHALLVGCGLVVVILVAFLFDWRTAFISLTAIPLSLIAAVVVLTAFGVTLNTMVIAGLVIALGEVVDDAIIDVENIVRRLRLNRAAGHPVSAFRVVVDASLEVRSAVVYATTIVIIVFLPIFFLDGIAGSFFRPLAMAYILAILASLFVALTVTPALSYLLLTGDGGRHAEAPLAGVLRRAYAAVLPHLIGRPWAALAVVLATFVLSGAAATRFGSEFLPEFQETDFLMHFITKPGASVEEMDRMTVLASRELRAIPGVRNFGSHIGRAEVADEVYGPNFTELWISVDPDVDYPATVKKIQHAMDGYPGMFCDVQTYLKERSKEVLSGSSASIVVRLFGPDLAVLRTKAKEAEKAMAAVDGVTNLKVESQTLLPQLEVRLRPEAAERYGLTPGHVRRATTTLLRGLKVGEVYEGQKRFDVVVWGVPECRDDVTAIQDLPIDTPAGVQVRLREVADVLVVPMPNEIKREAASRRLDITCDVRGRDLGAVAAEVEERVRGLPFDAGYHPEFLGEEAARRESSRRLSALAGLALLGVVLVIYSDFGSLRLTIIVAFTLPFALVGGGVGVLLSGGVLSLGSLVGFVTVLGIAARNGIMLVSHYRHLEDREGEGFGPGLVQRGSEERLAPILMTALATGLALLPLILSGQRPGHEVEYPLAVVILGGLVTSTLLNLFLLPPLYLRFGRRTPGEMTE
ncbi:efflux RND transporter permease subunit [Limnoglobus roseus]|uniref:AcrB/AcrD/AcrF family protein n=1 Tax=Limnoglobus roseus TaxID=2598579 RepID=A0A5C1AEX7_9BACT|nr:efflux RND transporter permease subunit [Limnoglobus roseus]QEL17979.1 AcrB/AcrD/AcrF family protein [Limnoglobus roseus]